MTIGCLQQCVISTNRSTRWRSCPLAIGASKGPFDGNQELDCRLKMASFAVPAMGNKAAATRWKPQLWGNVLQKRATLPRRPLRLETFKDRQTDFCLPWVKCSHLHSLYVYQVAITASSDELEASIALFLAMKEGDVPSSPSLLVNT